MPWQTPKTDWDTNPTNPLPSDFNRIEGNIDFLNTDIETKKGLIVNALGSVGIAALISDTHVQLASKITGAEKTGISITPGTANQEIPKGIYDTGGGIVLGDPDLISANIKAGANIFGVAGNSNVVDTSPGTAVAADILSGKVAFVDGAQVNGSMVDRGTVNQSLSIQGQQYTIPAGKHSGSGKVTASFANLSAENIKSGVNVGGIVGSLITAAMCYGVLTTANIFTMYVDVYRYADVNLGLPFTPSIVYLWQNGQWVTYFKGTLLAASVPPSVQGSNYTDFSVIGSNGNTSIISPIAGGFRYRTGTQAYSRFSADTTWIALP